MWDMAGDYGDSLLSLTVLERVRQLYPVDEWDIYVCCLPQYKEIYAHLDFIEGFVPYLGVKNWQVWEGARGQKKIVDVWLSPSLREETIHNGMDFQEFHPFSTNYKGLKPPMDPQSEPASLKY